MKTSIRTTVVSLLAAVALITSTSVAFAQETKTLKEALKDKFLIGTAVNTRQASGQDKAGVRVIQEQFNAIVAENCMKVRKCIRRRTVIISHRQMNLLLLERKIIWQPQDIR